MSETYLKGYELAEARLRDLVTANKWSRFGIISYDYELFTNEILLYPEQVCMAFSKVAHKTLGKNVLLVINLNRKGKLSLNSPETFDMLLKLVNKKLPEANTMYFGVREDLNVERLLASMESVKEAADIVAEALAAISEKVRKIKPEKLKNMNVEDFSKFLVKIMGPPSTLKDMSMRLQKGIEKRGGMTKFIASMASVTRLIEYLLTGAKGFFIVIKQHAFDKEFKEKLKEKEEEAKSLYSYDVIGKMLADEEETPFREGVNVVFTDCFGRNYGFLIPVIIQEFLRTFNEGIIVLDDLPQPDVYSKVIQWIVDRPDDVEGCKLALFVPSAYLPTVEECVDSVRKMVSEKCIVFDMNSDFFHTLHERASATVHAWLYEKFFEMEEKRREGECYFIHHDAFEEVNWEVISLRKGKIERLRGIFRRIF